MRRILPLVTVAAMAGGCSTLFPEFFGGNPPMHDGGTSDGGVGDGGGTPQISGTICILGDLRDYRSCKAGAPGMLRITVEETRDETMTDVGGRFTLMLAKPLSSATIAAVDPHGVYATTILPLRLPATAAASVALPVVDAQSLSNAALQNGMALDPTQGSVIGWAIDRSGAPVAGVVCSPGSALVEGGGPNELTQGNHTGSDGTVALLQAAPATATLMLTPPALLQLKGDSYVLPVRAGAVTVSTLVLAPQ
jgi:hypothetical protein